jgi:hypothetical protein
MITDHTAATSDDRTGGARIGGKLLAVVACTASVAGIGCVLGVASPALAASKSHTMSLQTAMVTDATTALAGQKNVVVFKLNEAGKAVGDAVLTCRPTPTSAVCRGDIALGNGDIYEAVRINTASGSVSGVVTGGDGKYVGATGMVNGTTTSAPTGNLTVRFQTTRGPGPHLPGCRRQDSRAMVKVVCSY